MTKTHSCPRRQLRLQTKRPLFSAVLAENDYPLAPVEEIVTKAKDAEQVYEQHLADAVKE